MYITYLGNLNVLSIFISVIMLHYHFVLIWQNFVILPLILLCLCMSVFETYYDSITVSHQSSNYLHWGVTGWCVRVQIPRQTSGHNTILLIIHNTILQYCNVIQCVQNVTFPLLLMYIYIIKWYNVLVVIYPLYSSLPPYSGRVAVGPFVI